MGTKSLPGQRHPGGVPWVNSALWCGGSLVRNPGGTPIFWPLPFRGDRLETKKGARELGLTTHSTSSTLTLTVHSPTKSNKGKWRKCAKSHYVIEAGLIWEWNRCPGSDTRVACHGWTVHCGAGGPRFETQGETPIFWPLPFRGDRLETKKGARELGLKLLKCFFAICLHVKRKGDWISGMNPAASSGTLLYWPALIPKCSINLVLVFGPCCCSQRKLFLLQVK